MNRNTTINAGSGGEGRRFLVAGLLCALLLGGTIGTVHADGYQKIARRLARDIAKRDLKKVALLSFAYPDEKISSGSSIVPEKLMPTFVDHKKLTVVERGLIKKILEEKKLEETGLLNPTGLKDLGTLLSVDVIVTGTLHDLDNGKTEVNARAIIPETGAVVSAVQRKVDRTWRDRPLKPKPPALAESRDPEEPPPPTNEAIQLLPPNDDRSPVRHRPFRPRFHR